MPLRFTPWLALGLCACSSASQPPARACALTPPESDWRLRAQGRQLVDSLGRAVFLRGVDAGGRSKFAPYVPFDYAPGQFAGALSAYLDRAASWGIDAMRVPFTWAALEPTEGQYDQDWLDRYRQILAAAWARGMWTVVDFHQDVYAENFCGDGFPGWTIPAPAPAPHHDCPDWGLEYVSDAGVRAAFDRFWADGSMVQQQYLAAWDAMIARFADEPGVVGFEPINEPGWGTADEQKFEATTLTAFYTKVALHMRAAANRSLVFVDPTGLSGLNVMTSLGRPAGDGVVFAPHFYPFNSSPDAALPQMQTWADVGAQWNAPVFVGEFGADQKDAGSAEKMAATFAAFDSLGLSGAQWEYSVEKEKWNGETNSVVAADGSEFPVAAALVRPFARAVAGSGIQQTWDGSTFAMSFAPAPGVTEIQLPARAFPNGPAVALSGGCYDVSSSPGRMLVQADAGATEVSLTIADR